MPSDYRKATQSFEVPKKNKRWRAPLCIVIILCACLAVFVAYDWRDISYLLPEPLRGTFTEAQFYDVDSDGSTTRYVYESLNEEDREKYRIVFKALTDCSKQAFPTDNLNEIRRIEDCVMADFPEFADQVALVNAKGGIFVPAYVAGVALANQEDLDFQTSQIEEAVNSCIAQIPSNADDYTKAKFAFDWLAENTSYGKEYEADDDRIVIKAVGSDSFKLDEGSSVPSEHGQTLYNALVQKRAVCAGYAKAYQYLLQQLGIECTYIEGTAMTGLHAWCVAKLDGDYYFIDPTWGDLEFEGNDDLQLSTQDVDYRYFAVTSEDIGKTHKAEEVFAIPICTAVFDNYFVREGLLFDQVDVPRLGSLVAEAFPSGLSVSIRCSSEEVYEEFMHNWIESGEIGRYSPTGSYQYAGDQTGLCTITLWPHYR